MGFIAVWHDGVSYSIPTDEDWIDGENILKDTKRIIKNTIQKERIKYKRKYRQLSLKL